MLTKETYEQFKEKSSEYFKKAGIVISEEEMEKFQVAEFGLGCPETIGLELVVYVNTDRCCAKELVLFPHQTCAEHRHPPIPPASDRKGMDGKEETFRCRFGEVYLYVPGEPAPEIKAEIPKERAEYFTCRHEIILHPGEQYTLAPDTLHWFQAGPEGAIVSEFSTKSMDDDDVFTDPMINPQLKINI